MLLLNLYYLQIGEIRATNNIIVTGSSSNHELSLIQFIYYCKKEINNINIVIWNLGFSSNFLKMIDLIIQKYRNIVIKNFNFTEYPLYFNINNNRGEFAWKPVIINITYFMYKKNILWLDSGCTISNNLKKVFFDINKYNCWSIFSSGTIEKWTHKGMLIYYNISNKFLKKKVCSGGVVGFKWNSKIAKKVLNEWAKCALVKECIAPFGSNNTNHRQDQSSLSLLLYKYNIFQNCPTNVYSIKTHQDLKNGDIAKQIFNKIIMLKV